MVDVHQLEEVIADDFRICRRHQEVGQVDGRIVPADDGPVDERHEFRLAIGAGAVTVKIANKIINNKFIVIITFRF